VTNLTFCEGITYSVPSNPKLFPNETALRAVYDNYTITNFKYFENAMMQIPCNTTSSAQYSLATSCDNCTKAYKDWFCAVLQIRNVGSAFWNGTLLPTDTPTFELANRTAAGRSSRNSLIDRVIQPGPYKELLPCDDLCYNVVRNCPAAIGFSCPLPGFVGFDTSYTQRFNLSADRAIMVPPQCNYPGASKTNSGHTTSPLSMHLLGIFSVSLLATLLR
jgi:calcium channel MID1